MPGVVQTATFIEVSQSDPLVLIVPPDYRDKGEAGQAEGDVGTWPAELSTAGRPKNEEERETHDLYHGGIFAEQTKAEPDPGPAPMFERIRLDGSPTGDEGS